MTTISGDDLTPADFSRMYHRALDAERQLQTARTALDWVRREALNHARTSETWEWVLDTVELGLHLAALAGTKEPAPEADEEVEPYYADGFPHPQVHSRRPTGYTIGEFIPIPSEGES